MTIDDYRKARDLVIEIDALEGEIRDLKNIMQNDTSFWRMEVRENSAFSPRNINHCGLLPEFLQAVLSKRLAKLHELEKELDKL
jgi:hypothetical protein